MGFAFLMIATGMQAATSGVAGVVMATVPAWTMLFAGIAGIDRFGVRQMAAVAIGTVAVVLLALPNGEHWAVRGIVALAAAALAHGCANIASQYSLHHSNPTSVARVSLVAAAVVTAPGAVAALPAPVPTVSAIIAIIALGALPSAAAYILYFHAIKVLGSTRASISNYLIPPVWNRLGHAGVGRTA